MEAEICVFTSTTMDSCRFFSTIITHNVSDKVLLDIIERSNEIEKRRFENWPEISIETFEASYIFPDEIAAILSRCEAIMLAQFASPYAIVIGDRVYSPMWIYSNTVEGWDAVGITPEMVAEKLPLWADIWLDDEADVAFSEKISEFVGEEISLSAMRDELS
jgi:hypothetical protein